MRLIKMNLAKAIMVMALTIEFLLITFLAVIPQIPDSLIIGRYMMYCFVGLILAFVVWYMLFYDEEVEKGRRVSNG